MNIVLFHIDDYNNKNILLKKCFKSIKREFKGHHIIVFHSFEEILEKFPQMRNDLKEKRFESFLSSNKVLVYLIDLYRILLTKYIDDMIYMDSDIYFSPGSGKKLINYFKSINENLICCWSTCLFYSKKYTDSIESLLNCFDENYTSDSDALKLSKIDEEPDYINANLLEDNSITHFMSLDIIKNFKLIKTDIIFDININHINFDDFNDIKLHETTCFYSQKFKKAIVVVVTEDKQWPVFYDFNYEVSFDDFLNALNNKEIN